MHPLHHVLVVDDDARLAPPLCAYMARFGLAAEAVGDVVQMWQHLAQRRVDLVVLDLLLPGADGLALAQALRAKSPLPLILVSALGSVADRVVGLEMGADDYLAKPFEPRELVARIHSVLRRAGPPADAAPRLPVLDDLVHFDGWTLQRERRLLTSPTGAVVALSSAEFQLLNTFLKTPRCVVSRAQLLAQARGRALDDVGRSIDLLVSRLRHKLTDAGSGVAGATRHEAVGSLIKTVRGAGYLFDARSVQGLARLSPAA